MIPAVPDAKPRAKPQGGVVVAHSLNLPRRALVFLIACVIRLIAVTLRYRWEFHPGVLENQNRPVIFCTWHNRVVLSSVIHRAYSRRLQQSRDLAAVVSASRDGAIIAGVLERFGIESARGSSSRRGAQAFLELLSAAERGCDLAVTPDGPRGPRYVAQMGTIALAQLTGKPIIPAACNLRWKLCLKSWDRFQIPLPFSRAITKFGEPMTIPADQTTDEQRELFRAELQRRLDALTED
jgi:lysophospholipid acyltransferase (LPLAT)-like uncharacterized protein